jgi:hypothetical protein
VRFLAFVHRGEQRGRRQFERYAAHFEARGDARTRQLFEAILTDEHRHERYTRELLVELAGSERAARAELRRAALWEAWRMWRRAGRTLATAIYTLAMIAIYLVAGAIAVTAAFAARRRQRTGWQLPPGRTSPVTVLGDVPVPLRSAASIDGTTPARVPAPSRIAAPASPTVTASAVPAAPSSTASNAAAPSPSSTASPTGATTARDGVSATAPSNKEA